MLLAFLVVAQGGYYPEECSIVLVLFVAMLLAKIGMHLMGRCSFAISIPGSMFVLAACAYVASGTLNGYGVSRSLACAAPILLAACGCFMAANISASERRFCRSAIAWLGAASGFIGILMFIGLLPYPGSVSAGRLFFTFQYANAAGIWFAAVSLLGLSSPSKRLRAASLFSLIALILTQSIGAMVLFAAAAMGLLLRACKQADAEKRRHFAFALTLLIVMCACVVAWMACTGRIVQAIGTLNERLAQMHDAMELLSSHALLGLGPDGWKTSYSEVQSAEYVSSVVHCSYLQVAVEAGIPALAFLLVAIGSGFVSTIKRKDATGVAVICLISLHAVFDFDFRFGAITMLLSFFLGTPSFSIMRKRKGSELMAAAGDREPRGL